MSGIYIHIPFCKKACHYCDFHFSTSLKNKSSFLSALKKEIVLQKNYLNNDSISTVYFGGGTPSLLEEKELDEIFELLHNTFNIENDAEITLEANPDDLTIKKIQEIQKTPINRLSIGIQSFFDSDLIWMNRSHNSEQAINSVKKAQDAGIKNINIDLIYGIPSLTNDDWKTNLNTAFSLNIQHISAYCLTVEKGTALDNFIKKGKSKNIDEIKSTEHFNILLEETEENNFIQYEISNFCKKDFYSKHNSNYWLKKNYLGLGPSAHSYNGKERQWNVSNNAQYINLIESQEKYWEKEVLTPQNNYNEYIMTSLRTIWGIDVEFVKKSFEEKYFYHLLKELVPFVKNGYIALINNKIQLTTKGKLIADKIASDLFIV